jgi:hypothetical protein
MVTDHSSVMSDPEADAKRPVRSTGPDRFWFWFSVVFLFSLSAGNIFLSLYIVPKFEQIFAEALPGKPLPEVTEFVITGKFLLAIFTLCWPIITGLLIRLRKPGAIWWINIGIIWNILQISITILALFIPMIGTN